jgi:hypothetical protein
VWESEVKFLSPPGVPSSASRVRRQGWGTRAPETCRAGILRASSSNREVESDRCCDTAEVGLATGARVGEKGIGSVDGRDEDGTSGRS